VGYRNQELQPLRKRLVVRAASTFFTLISGVILAFSEKYPCTPFMGEFCKNALLMPLDATQMIF